MRRSKSFQSAPISQPVNQWLQGFVSRNNWSLRARTSLAQNLPAQLEQKLCGFFTEVQKGKKSGRYPLALIGNMDETPMYYDLVPSCTIVLTTSADKRHLTIVLTETADGKMPPPMIISKENDELPNMYILQALSSRLKRKG